MPSMFMFGTKGLVAIDSIFLQVAHNRTVWERFKVGKPAKQAFGLNASKAKKEQI